MKKTNSKLSKALFLLAFVLFFYSFIGHSQDVKFPAEFHTSYKSGKVVTGDKVIFSFLLTNIENGGNYQSVLSTLTKQDGVKGEVEAFDRSSGQAKCSLTFNNPSVNPYKPAHLRKYFTSLGVSGVYFDNDYVKTEDIDSYILTKEKQEHPELIGK